MQRTVDARFDKADVGRLADGVLNNLHEIRATGKNSYKRKEIAWDAVAQHVTEGT